MVINDVYVPYINNQTRHLVLYGSAASGKSRFAAQKIIRRTLTEVPHRFLVLRKVGATVKDSVYQELIDVIDEQYINSEFQINKSEKSFLHLPTGNTIHCKGLDEPEKIKSVSGITGMWLEEATEFNENDIDQLNMRIRGKKENYVQFIYTFNPIDEDHFLKKRFVDQKDHPDIEYKQTTYKDNKFLTEEDVKQLESYKETNPLYYQIYCLGEWGIVDKTGKFLYSFDSELHVDNCEVDLDIPLKLSFDFNIDPFACIVYQSDKDFMRVIEEIRLPNSDIYQMCDTVRAKYPPSKFFYVCTGDRTGYNNTGVVRGKTSYWMIIKEELNLSMPQLKLRSKNLDLVESRVLCNSALYQKDVAIDPSCKTLIRDCKYSIVDNKGVLLKDRDKNMNDFLDCFRYALDAEYPDLSRKPKKTR